MASDIDKEEEALRAGMVERCELTLQSRLEPPTLTKDTSIGMYFSREILLQRHFRICNIKISEFFVKSIYSFLFLSQTQLEQKT